MSTIICIGDSLTYGFGVRRAQCWTKLAAEMSGWTIVNCGICGDTTGGMLVRMREILHDDFGEKNDGKDSKNGGDRIEVTIPDQENP